MKIKWAATGVHENVIKLLEEGKRGKLLDIGCGRGELSVALKNSGFDVSSCDILPDVFEPADIPFKVVDLKDGIGYPDGCFDFAIAVEVIEHLENIFFFIQELSRILKRGGKAIISTPNNEHIQAKLFYLFSGRFPGFRRVNFEFTHINPIYFHYLPLIIGKNNLQLEQIIYNRGFIYLFPQKLDKSAESIPENGITIPFRNKSWGQVAIIKMVKLGE